MDDGWQKPGLAMASHEDIVSISISQSWDGARIWEKVQFGPALTECRPVQKNICSWSLIFAHSLTSQEENVPDQGKIHHPFHLAE
jgi:hypothetical protein